MRENDDRSYQARNAEQFDDAAFLDAVRTVDEPPATTAAVREVVGCSQDTAKRRLDRLETAGKVTKRRAGNTFLWSIVNED